MRMYAASFAIAALTLSLDQWTKFWVEANMELDETFPLWGAFLELHAVHNEGAAWSIFAGARWMLVTVTAVMLAVIVAVLALRLVRHPLGVLSAFLILSGGLGNLMDRIFLGYVVDMLHFPFWPSYPTFNVADVCVVTGCGLWLLYILAVRENYNDVAVAEEDLPGAPVRERRSGGGRNASGKASAGPAPVDRPPAQAPEVPETPHPAGTRDYDPWSGGTPFHRYDLSEDGGAGDADTEPDVLRDPRSDSSLYRRY